jgi:hypothetical protein
MNQEFYKEYMNVLATDPLSLPVWLMLQYKFMSPAAMIAKGDKMEQYMKMYSLNGLKVPTICKP